MREETSILEAQGDQDTLLEAPTFDEEFDVASSQAPAFNKEDDLVIDCFSQLSLTVGNFDIQGA